MTMKNILTIAFMLVALVACRPAQNDDELLDVVWEGYRKENSIAMSHLDKGRQHLNNDDMDAFFNEFDEYIKHMHASYVLWDIWINESMR